MPQYLVKFPPYVTVGSKKEVLEELESRGGKYVRENRFRKGYVYDVPDENLDATKFRTRDYLFSVEKQPEE